MSDKQSLWQAVDSQKYDRTCGCLSKNYGYSLFGAETPSAAAPNSVCGPSPPGSRRSKHHQQAINLQNTVKKLRIGSILLIFEIRQSKVEIDELKRTD